MRLAIAWSGWRCSQYGRITSSGRSRRTRLDQRVLVLGQVREPRVGQAEALAVRDAQDRAPRPSPPARASRACPGCRTRRASGPRARPAARARPRARAVPPMTSSASSGWAQMPAMSNVGRRSSRLRQHLLVVPLVLRHDAVGAEQRRPRAAAPPGPCARAARRPSGSRSCARPCPRCRRPAAGSRSRCAAPPRAGRPRRSRRPAPRRPSPPARTARTTPARTAAGTRRPAPVSSSMRSWRPRKRTRSCRPRRRASACADARSGPLADHQQHRRHLAAHPLEDAHHVHHALHRAEVRDVQQDLLARRRANARCGRWYARVAAVDRQVDEVVDDLDVVLHLELVDGHPLQELGDGGDAVRLLDAEARDLEERAVLAHQRDVGAVQRRDELGRRRAEHLLREEARRWRAGSRSARGAGRACARAPTSAIFAASARSCGGYSKRQ